MACGLPLATSYRGQAIFFGFRWKFGVNKAEPKRGEVSHWYEARKLSRFDTRAVFD